ncbi:hypothetical protein RRG08_022850 [Elysia crispata]|uniref:Uncharacterized protein n=1 Tax=Elysia crispata TaxID=231223 RepID=A0AAE0Z0M4_9GAST|nr:hypothetical protein RRG08_022850 [Elysia crispata]
MFTRFLDNVTDVVTLVTITEDLILIATRHQVDLSTLGQESGSEVTCFQVLTYVPTLYWADRHLVESIRTKNAIHSICRLEYLMIKNGQPSSLSEEKHCSQRSEACDKLRRLMLMYVKKIRPYRLDCPPGQGSPLGLSGHGLGRCRSDKPAPVGEQCRVKVHASLYPVLMGSSISYSLRISDPNILHSSFAVFGSDVTLGEGTCLTLSCPHGFKYREQFENQRSQYPSLMFRCVW